VTLAVQVALVLFGLLLVPLAVQQEWSAQPDMWVVTLPLLGTTISGPLLSVSLILGAFSGLYFTIAALSDSTYRAEFFSDADRELDDVLAARAVYRATLRRSAVAPASVVAADPMAVEAGGR
jgi:hypothetical protein